MPKTNQKIVSSIRREKNTLTDLLNLTDVEKDPFKKEILKGKVKNTMERLKEYYKKLSN